MGMTQRAYSILGRVAIVNFPDDTKASVKKTFAKELLEKNKSIRTVLEKSGKFKGRLRKQETKFLAGENTKEVLHRENGCEFRFNIDSTYFSPRLANERKEMSEVVKKGEEVFIMFSGVCPFPIVVGKNSKAKKVYANKLNREANKYAELNIKKNKLRDKVKLIPGDCKKICSRLQEEGKTYDVVMMPRPNLDDSFLEDAFKVTRKGTRVYYYGFCHLDNRDEMVEMIYAEAKKAGKKIKILNKKNAGDTAPYKIRYRIDFEVTNGPSNFCLWLKNLFR